MPLAQELIALQPEVILAQATEVAATLQRESRTIPIVFNNNVADPIGAGFVASLAQPGGNLTGVLLYEAGIVGKWLALLKEIAPRLSAPPSSAIRRQPHLVTSSARRQPRRRRWRSSLCRLPIENATADVERVIESFASSPNGGLVVLPDPTTAGRRADIIGLAARHRLPAVYPFRFYVDDGGLMSYGTDRSAIFRLSATYVDRILRGARPADLPVQAPTQYETIVNLKTAKAIGLDVPPSLLVRADEVIE